MYERLFATFSQEYSSGSVNTLKCVKLWKLFHSGAKRSKSEHLIQLQTRTSAPDSAASNQIVDLTFHSKPLGDFR